MTVLQLVLATGVALMAPVLFAALGEIVSERGGILNLGIEGVLVASALGTALTFERTHSVLAAVAVALAVGAACGAVLSALLVARGTDQVVTGIVFSSAAAAAAAIVADQDGTTSRVASLPRVAVPLLSDIPWVGPVVFEQNPLVYVSLLMVPMVFLLVNHTWFGLHLRVAGERPIVDEVAGVSVRAVRVAGLQVGCMLTALGGATLVLSTASVFQVGITNGRGFVALGIVVLAKWNPFAAAGGALLFGIADALQFQTGSIPGLRDLPTQLVLMIPFVLAVAIVIATKGTRYPAAVGQHYRPQKLA